MIQSNALTIRDRGQLTIPDEIREAFTWLSIGAVVQFVGVGEEVKVIPYERTQKPPNWLKIREGIELARSFTGKRGNLSTFVARDRATH